MEQIGYFHTQKTRPMTIGYLLFTPDDLRPDETLPLIVFLHGAGERGENIRDVKRHGLPKLWGRGERPVRAIVLCPQCPSDDFWNAMTHELKELIDAVAAAQPVDPDRISLTGISMGGFGTWATAITYPSFFSAIAPICGGGMAWSAPVLGQLPIRAFHGDCDTIVEPQYSLQMVQAVNRFGGHALLELCPGLDHDCWTYAYEQTDLLSWLIAQKRKG